MSNGYTFILALGLAGLVLWQLVTGKALDMYWRPTVTRKENPRMYWFVLTVQSGILMVIQVTGKSTWQL
jgi:hypothetical protein